MAHSDNFFFFFNIVTLNTREWRRVMVGEGIRASISGQSMITFGIFKKKNVNQWHFLLNSKLSIFNSVARNSGTLSYYEFWTSACA